MTRVTVESSNVELEGRGLGGNLRLSGLKPGQVHVDRRQAKQNTQVASKSLDISTQQTQRKIVENGGVIFHSLNMDTTKIW